MPTGERHVYVYGVLPAADQAAVSVNGVEGSAVRTVEQGELAALVSDLQGDALTAGREVRAHWRVLEEASNGATVLPVRFGTVMESERAVREGMLEQGAERLTALLRELAGRVQLIVSGDYDEDQVLREVVQASPAVAALRERVRGLSAQAGYYERIRLGEAVAGAVARRREQDAALALERLEPLAVASRAEEPGTANAAFKLAFLVESGGVDAFSAAVRKLGDELGERVVLRYVGPMPPYNFAEAELQTGSGAWA